MKSFQFYHECECARDLPRSTFTPTLPLSVVMSESPTTFSTSRSTSTTKEAITTTSSPTLALQSENITSLFGASAVAEIAQQKEKTDDINDEVYADYRGGEGDVEYEDDEYKKLEADEKEENYDDNFNATEKPGRERRETGEVWGKLVPGACIKGCAFGFYAFSIVSSIINCFGASGRIGNMLVNYRCVSNQDKSVTQGLILMLVSLFALIPGPVIFGRIIDATCLVWTEQCSGRRGNCQLYDQRRFRYYINLTAFFLTGIGVFFDVLVWKYGKNLDLYGEREEEMLKKKQAKSGRN